MTDKGPLEAAYDRASAEYPGDWPDGLDTVSVGYGYGLAIRASAETVEDDLQRWSPDEHGHMLPDPLGRWVSYAEVRARFFHHE